MRRVCNVQELPPGASQREFAVSTERAECERKVAVILGAGASHGARERPAPPLGKDLLDYLDAYLTLIERQVGLGEIYLPFRKNEELASLRRLINKGKVNYWTYEQLTDRVVATGDPYNENLALLNRLLVAAFSPIVGS